MGKIDYAKALRMARRRKAQNLAEGGESGSESGTASPGSSLGGYSYGAYSGAGGGSGGSESYTGSLGGDSYVQAQQQAISEALASKAAGTKSAENANKIVNTIGSLLSPLTFGLSSAGAKALTQDTEAAGNRAMFSQYTSTPSKSSEATGYQGSTSGNESRAVEAFEDQSVEADAAASEVLDEAADKLKADAAAQNALTMSKITGTIGPWQTQTYARGGRVEHLASGGTSGLLGTSVDPATVDATQSTYQAQQAALDEISGYGNAVAGGAQGVQAAQQAASTTAANQTELAKLIAQRAAGTGTSVAQQQLRQTTDENVKKAAGTIASAKGVNPALAARIAATSGAAANQTAAGQSATLAAQEQTAAQELAASTLGTQRSQDIEQQNAALGLMTGAGTLQNTQNQLRIQNLAQEQALNQSTASQNAALATGADTTTAQLATQAATQNAGTNTAILSGVLSGVGTATSNLFARGGKVDYRRGGRVPGNARVSGDDERNDIVDAKLSPGEFVTKRTVAQKPGVRTALEELNENPEMARAFVKALREMRAKDDSEYGRVVQKRRSIEDRLARLERMAEGGEVEKEEGNTIDDPEHESPGMVEAIKRWFTGDRSVEQGREVANEIDEALPKGLSIADAMRLKRKQWAQLDELARR
jgi:hypothetical protein